MMVFASCGTGTGVTLVTDGVVRLSGLSDEFNDSGGDCFFGFSADTSVTFSLVN